MNADLEKALLQVIHTVSEAFGPTAVVKGGMSLRLQGIPRSTVDVDYGFQPYKRKTPFMTELVEVVAGICEDEPVVRADSKKVQIRGTVLGVDIVVEASPHPAIEPDAIPTTAMASRLGMPPAIVSVMPGPEAFAHKLGAWFDRRLVRDLYDIYVYYELLDALPNRTLLLDRIRNPNFARGVKKRPKLQTISEFETFLKKEVRTTSPEELERQLQGLVDERERVGLGQLILTSVRRMRFSEHS